MHVIKWKYFQRSFPFVGGIHRSPVNSPHKGQWRGAFDIFFDLHPNKRLSKQSWGWWFETPLHPLWRHCNGSSTYVTLSPRNVTLTINMYMYRVRLLLVFGHWTVTTTLTRLIFHISKNKYTVSIFVITDSINCRNCSFSHLADSASRSTSEIWKVAYCLGALNRARLTQLSEVSHI